mmetsp:Transcript_54033/g.107557  ORF Transcript_54033/g.107557 Transcript_54033/m.107557 type:complete len:112 (+) Transcript_54033:86-421(+)
MGAIIAKLPGAFEVIPQHLSALPAEICRQRLISETGATADGLNDDQVRDHLEAALTKRYCPRFLCGVLFGLTAWACVVAVTKYEGMACLMLALIPAPAILSMPAPKSSVAS